jgi:hypothetical protein
VDNSILLCRAGGGPIKDVVVEQSNGHAGEGAVGLPTTSTKELEKCQSLSSSPQRSLMQQLLSATLFKCAVPVAFLLISHRQKVVLLPVYITTVILHIPLQYHRYNSSLQSCDGMTQILGHLKKDTWPHLPFVSAQCAEHEHRFDITKLAFESLFGCLPANCAASFAWV